MAITRLSVAYKNQLLTALLSNGTNTYTMLSTVAIYTGSPPASPETAASGTLLCTTGNLTGFAQASNGVGVLNSALTFTPTVTGTAGWARWNQGAGSVGIDVDLGIASSGAGMILSTLSLVNGTPASINNASIQMPTSFGTVLLNTALRNKLVDVMLQAVANIGLGYSASILVYSGAAPATADAPATGTLLATFPTGTAGWATPSAGSAALSATLTVAASATGTAGYARIVKGSYVLQCSIGTTGTDMTIDSVSLTSGANTNITNATFSL